MLTHETNLTSSVDTNIDSHRAALWTRNERESRLLQLPAEIRLQIFDYVIGFWIIHTHLSWNDMIAGFTYRCLKDTQPCIEYYEAGHPLGFPAHRSPRNAVPFDPSITVLSTVCRQLYRETAALPFKKFIWAFDTAFTLERFLAAETKTNLQHKSAIRTVLVPSPGPYRASEQKLVELRTVMLAGRLDPRSNGFGPPVSRALFDSPATIVTLTKVRFGKTWVWNDQHAVFAKDLFEQSAFPRRKDRYAHW